VSPTARSLAELRKRGYLADVVERKVTKWISKDLFGIIDILAVRRGEVLGVQATSGSNVAARVKKIENHENVGAVREANIQLSVWGWRKNAAGRWVLREIDVS